MKKLFSFLILMATLLSGQTADTYFPQQAGYKWYYEVTPYDSLNNPVDDLATIRVDSFATTGLYHGKEAQITLTKTGTRDLINTIPYLDTTAYSFEGSIASQHIDAFAFADSSLFPDSSFLSILNDIAGWYEAYRFAQPVGNSYNLYSVDQTVNINDIDLPLRIEVNGERGADEVVSTIYGDVTCKKITISIKVSALIIGFPIKLFEYPSEFYIAEDIWVVREYSPSVSVDLSQFELPAFFIPGREAVLINPPARIRLTAPTGHEVFYNTDSTYIMWGSWNTSGVKLEYSSNNGGNWNIIEENYPTVDGYSEYNWHLPDVESDEMLVKVTATDDETATAQSNSAFSVIGEQAFEFVKPGNMESVLPGVDYTIEWTSENVAVGDLFFSSDSGASYTQVAEGIEATSGQYVWSVPNIESDNCFLKFVERRTGAEFVSNRFILIIMGAIEDELNPEEYALHDNYPNPFNPSTKIAYSVAKGENVKLSVYNVLGEKVATLVNEYKNKGVYTVEFNAVGLSSGVYIYRLSAGNYIFTKKMILTK